MHKSVLGCALGAEVSCFPELLGYIYPHNSRVDGQPEDSLATLCIPCSGNISPPTPRPFLGIEVR